MRSFTLRTAATAVLVCLLGSGSAAARSGAAGQPRSPTAAATRTPASRASASRYTAPVVGRLVVLRSFRPPPTPYAAGHRGVDLAVSAHAMVLAAAAGRVRFAGLVAGRGVVVVLHADGVSTEYEPVDPSVQVGVTVGRGAPIGRIHGQHGGCVPDGCLHWGARRGGVYLDPMRLLRPLGPVRLLPWSAD